MLTKTWVEESVGKLNKTISVKVFKKATVPIAMHNHAPVQFIFGKKWQNFPYFSSVCKQIRICFAQVLKYVHSTCTCYVMLQYHIWCRTYMHTSNMGSYLHIGLLGDPTEKWSWLCCVAANSRWCLDTEALLQTKTGKYVWTIFTKGKYG